MIITEWICGSYLPSTVTSCHIPDKSLHSSRSRGHRLVTINIYSSPIKHRQKNADLDILTMFNRAKYILRLFWSWWVKHKVIPDIRNLLSTITLLYLVTLQREKNNEHNLDIFFVLLRRVIKINYPDDANDALIMRNIYIDPLIVFSVKRNPVYICYHSPFSTLTNLNL